MNSAPVLDSSSAAAKAPTPQLPKFSAPKKEGAACAPFGAVLEQITADSTAPDDVEADLETPEVPKEEKSEKDEDGSVLNVIPFVCVCPPPEIISLPTVSATGDAVASQAVTETSKEAPQQTEEPVTQPIETAPETTAEAVEALRPNQAEIPGRRAHRTKTQETPKTEEKTAEATEPDKVIKLDPQVFKMTSPEPLEVPHFQASKAPEAARPLPLPTARGTLVAQQDKAMKNGEKAADIAAPAVAQKMPTREFFRKMSPEVVRFESSSFTPEFSKPEVLSAAPTVATAVKSLDAAHLVETIRSEVSHLRQRGDNVITVALKPDNGTELHIEISIGRDGAVQAHARCERGDFQSLSAQWPQLQQSLAAHGIRMTDLSTPGDGQHQQGQAQNQNFERGNNNNSQNRGQQNQRTFEEELVSSSTPRYAAGKNQKPAAGATRRWQSWA